MARLVVKSLHTHHIGPISLTIDSGQCVAILGQSGSGKTLMLRAIADLDPHTGNILLDNKPCDLFAPPQWHKEVGFLCAKPLWWHDTVGEHFTFVSNPKLEQNLTQWLMQLNLANDIMSWSTRRLSTGEQQRLALLRLLINQPKALLLDEPSASLDNENTDSMELLIKQYQQERHTAIVWVTHDISQAQRVADQIYRLDQGALNRFNKK